MKSVFFTGATGGLGQVCVQALSGRGWQVFAAGTNEARLAQLGQLPHVVPVRTDVCSQQSVEAARDAVLQHTDRLDVVVNFAGISAFASLVEGQALPILQRNLDINLMGTARVNAVMLPLLERASGRIVNCSSSVGWTTAQPFAGAYTASKRALEGYNDSLRRELMFVSIPVIKLQFGAYNTDMVGQLEAQFDQTLRQTTRYQAMLQRLWPLMLAVLHSSRDPREVVPVVVKALESPRPRRQYRLGTGWALSLLELLPEGGVDRLYRLLGRLAQGRRKAT